MAERRKDFGQNKDFRRAEEPADVENDSGTGDLMGTSSGVESDWKQDLPSIVLLLILYTLQGIPMGLSGSIPFLLLEKVTLYTKRLAYTPHLLIGPTTAVHSSSNVLVRTYHMIRSIILYEVHMYIHIYNTYIYTYYTYRVHKYIGTCGGDIKCKEENAATGRRNTAVLRKSPTPGTSLFQTKRSGSMDAYKYIYKGMNDEYSLVYI